MRSLARTALAAGALGALGALFASPAAANFHLMRIVQVYGGDLRHPDAQYAVLQMCTGGQNFLQGHSVGFFAADGSSLGTATFTSMMPNGATQSKVLIATSSAETVFGLTADLRMPASIASAGGKFCFEPGPFPIDCVAWGTYSPIDPTVGNPFGPVFGLEPGEAAQRDLAIVPPPTTLECVTTQDDTDDSAADFDATNFPAPGNNAGVTGEPEPLHLFVHGFEGDSVFGWSFMQP